MINRCIQIIREFQRKNDIMPDALIMHPRDFHNLQKEISLENRLDLFDIENSTFYGIKVLVDSDSERIFAARYFRDNELIIYDSDATPYAASLLQYTRI